MTFAQCMDSAQSLKRHMTAHGVKCSIELLPGRGDDPWELVKKYLRMHHHTASWYRAGGNLTPIYSVVRQGRPDLVGPLANGYGGFDLVYRIICMGLANHAGLGGPITIDGVFIPRDSARRPTWGTEWEGGFQIWNTIPGMLEFMGRSDNALADWMGRPLTSQMEHSTWTPRKVDRKDFTRTIGVALTKKWDVTSPKPPSPEDLDVEPILVRMTDNTAWMIWPGFRQRIVGQEDFNLAKLLYGAKFDTKTNNAFTNIPDQFIKDHRDVATL